MTTGGGGSPAGPDPASGTGTRETDDGDFLPSDDSNDASLSSEGQSSEGLSSGGGDGPRHLRPPRTVADYGRALRGRLRAQAPLAAVLAVAVLAFVRIGLQHWRDGTAILGAALLLAAVLRAALSERTVGLLAVRPRRTDVVTYALFGVVVILLALTITGGPLASR